MYRYVPAVVDHGDDLPCSGTYMLHQGIQRRLAITITHEQGPDFFWKDVKELVVGKWSHTSAVRATGAKNIFVWNYRNMYYIFL